MSGRRKKYRGGNPYPSDMASGPYGGGGGGGGGWGRNYGQGNRSSGSYNQYRRGGRGMRDSMVNPWEDGLVPGISGYGHSSDGYAGYSKGDFFDDRRGSVYGRLGARVRPQGSPRSRNQPWRDGLRLNWALYQDKKKFPIKSKPRFKAKKKTKTNPAAVKKALTTDEGKAENPPGKEENTEVKSQGVTKEPTDSQPSEAETSKGGTEEAEKKTESAPKHVDGDGQEKLSEGSKKEEVIPPEALLCHICDKQSFKTLHGFETHLDGKNHNRLARVYLEKMYSMLELLKAQSRLQSQQNIVRMRKEKGKILMCSQCECPIKGGLNFHYRLRAHGLVSSFTKCVLCKVRCNSRAALEKHFLTTKHLARAHKVWLRDLFGAVKIRNHDYGFPEMEAMNKLHDAIHEIRLSRLKTLTWNLAQLDAYDPSRIYGVNYMERVPQFYCTICSKKVLHTAKEAYDHFHSQTHYKNYVAHLMALEDKKLEVNKENQSSEDKEAEDANISLDIEKELKALEGIAAEMTCAMADESETVAAQQEIQPKDSCEDEPSTEATDTRITTPAPDKSESNPQATEENIVTLNGDEDVILCEEENVSPAQENDVTACERKDSSEPLEVEIFGETDMKDDGEDVEVINEAYDVEEIDKMDDVKETGKPLDVGEDEEAHNVSEINELHDVEEVGEPLDLDENGKPHDVPLIDIA